MKQVLLLIGLIGLFSCSENPDKILVENNFDGLNGWGIEHASLTSERAHSGKFAIKVDANLEFSLTFKQVLGSITNKKPKEIEVEFWAYIPSESAKANFVCTLTEPRGTKQKFWQGFNLIDKTKNYREWVKISKRLKLPDNVQLSDKLSCYLWRPEASEEVVYIDDLKITVLE